MNLKCILSDHDSENSSEECTQDYRWNEFYYTICRMVLWKRLSKSNNECMCTCLVKKNNKVAFKVSKESVLFKKN